MLFRSVLDFRTKIHNGGIAASNNAVGTDSRLVVAVLDAVESVVESLIFCNFMKKASKRFLKFIKRMDRTHKTVLARATVWLSKNARCLLRSGKRVAATRSLMPIMESYWALVSPEREGAIEERSVGYSVKTLIYGV